MITALAGGVGGAKLAYGLAQLLPPQEFTIIVNTADDLILHGLYICPDIDTVTYTLAGIANPETGWGIMGDTFNVHARLASLGRESWFILGDKDLATHIVRTQLLREGQSLTQVTSFLAKALGVEVEILPMSDDRVATFITTDEGELPFQDYFVRLRQRGQVRKVRFEGVEEAQPTEEVLSAIDGARAIILCSSNPIVSILPILSLKGVRDRIKASPALKVAVSPIVGGKAIRGPADKMMRGLGMEASAYGVAEFYRDLLNLFVCDLRDEGEVERISSLGIKVILTDTIMESSEEKVALARKILDSL